MNRTRTFSILVLPLLALSACSWSGNDGGDQADTAQVMQDEVFGGDVPADWPTDVPMYEGAQVQYSGSANPANGRPGHMMVLQSSDSAEDVYAFYQQSLVDNGWTVESQAGAAGANTLVAKKEGRTVSLLVTAYDGATAISIGVEQDGEQE